MKRALISVSDKTGIVELSKELVELGYEIISTGGTKKTLDEAGIKTLSISDITSFPEIMDGRVKTLHPNVHGALLCVRDNKNHLKALEDNKIDLIDMVVVNLYPFKETLARKNVTHEELIENIDIGGPSMLRSAAKNYKSVTVIVDPKDYKTVVCELKEDGDTLLETRERLAAKVFRHTSSYDTLIAEYLTNKVEEKFPETITVTYEKVQDLRYGENPHQKAGFYKKSFVGYSIGNARQLHGKELSYNNIQDANAALEILKEFDKPTVVAVKHMNPCGVGSGKNIKEAWNKAYEADKISIFGGIVAVNSCITIEVAEQLSQLFLEIVIAPSYEEKALEILTKKKNIRVLELDTKNDILNKMKITSVMDGALVQEFDEMKVLKNELIYVTEKKPTDDEIEELLFNWNVVKHVKSNAIVIGKENQTIGIGAGQMNRVGAAKIALEQGGEKCKGAILASDAFFPMDDTVELAARYGIKAIIQPGGSIKDSLSIEACNKYGIAMVFTGVRHFKH
ncbi:bifunctional phosphoribosylaminoimidazolecarboxamide formyltransferase/IMP cyclohydrolase [Cetobacterium somerae]|uniref:bifunctional phosphoribosylaminoimidazolecarboxamide formyltransferase/IMP cyclohydrolase n=1 Tax=Cetobacterium sp. NK01 TaxID=2993530 RepID=UPI0021162D4C|nr:bifunctional phosphoribosylaminoimidazolecarboxamide formyltransferase/IMP cyclohydrolase [Cetobacterium sp. NK01]MCQ8212445.1 bifunctional phosphoribosylaminoimidazolecarboxamide formyltransferase/IMP cyclohydrolase [Cetobacterium sp. NK01]